MTIRIHNAICARGAKPLIWPALLQVQHSSSDKGRFRGTRTQATSAESQSVEAMPKRAAQESNGAPAPADAHDERVASLRREMAKHNVQAYIVPSEDPHMVGQLCW